MVLCVKSSGPLVLRLLAVLALLGCPQMGSAAAAWSVISLQKPGEVISPTALAADTAGNLYVADMADWGKGRIQKRDAQGNWSILATAGDAPGQVDFPTGLAVHTADDLYVADGSDGVRIQKRDAHGNWTVIATSGTAVGQISGPEGLAVDAAGNLFVADTGNDRVQEYTPLPGP